MVLVWEISNIVKSNFPEWDNALCYKNQILMLLVAKFGNFCIQVELFRCQSNPGS